MVNTNSSCLILFLLPLFLVAKAEQCDSHVDGAVCPNGMCCSKFGFCGNTDQVWFVCESDCESSPTPPTPSKGGGGDVGSIITSDLFDQMLIYKDDQRCPGHGFYTYDGFVVAAKSFNGFGTTGDNTTRRRELAAFLAQTSHETTGGWPSAPDGPYAWGYCYVTEKNADGDFCTSSSDWPCAPGKRYYGRGPIQLTYNFNYGQAGKAIDEDLINNPDLVSTNPTVSFKTAIWFWMTPQANRPSSHDVITGRWTPSSADSSAGRVPGYGVISNIINGGLECGHDQDPQGDDRVGFYKRYCEILGVSPGDNLDCNNQKPFA